MTRACLTCLALLAACTADPSDDDGAVDSDAPPAGPTVTTTTAALQTLDFARELDGVSRGFDLDGQDGGCDTTDLVAPDGTGGIDNNFATLLPLMERVGGAAFEDLIQGAVDSGEFLLLLRVTDDGSACVGFDVFRASEPGLVGADGALLAHQTLPVGEEPMVSTACATWEDDRTLVATGLFMPLQIEIFDARIDLGYELASFRVHLEDDGRMWGEAGGGIDVAELWSQIGVLGGIGTQLLGVLESVLFLKTDLAPTGEACTHMSATLAFEGTPAFLYEGEE